MGKSFIVSTNSELFASGFIARIKSDLGITPVDYSDLYELRQPEDKQSIGIESVQELKIWSFTKPYRAPNKLAIIWTAEILTIEAQNAALKILEEPPESTHLVLITSNHSMLLSTIQSRCELVLDPETRHSEVDLKEFIAADLLDRLTLMESFEKIKDSSLKHREQEEFLVALLNYCRAEIRKKIGAGHEEEAKVWVQNATIINTVQKMLTGRVPAKACFDYLIVNLELSPKMV